MFDTALSGLSVSSWDGVTSMEAQAMQSANPTRANEQYDGAAHAIQEFSAGVQFMIESGDAAKVDVGSLIESLVKALQGQAQKPVVHPLMYVNLAFVLGLAFACGSLWTRVATGESRTSALETKTQAVELIPVVNAKMDMFQQEVTHLRDMMDDQMKKR
jgi:hypothetical protein